MRDWDIHNKNRRGLLMTAAAAGATLVMPRLILAAADKPTKAAHGGDLTPVRAAIEKQRPEAIKRLQNWIALPSIAAENRNMQEGVQMMIDLLKDAGFQSAKVMPTDGQPGSIRDLLAGLQRYDATPIDDHGNTIGLKQGGASISLEPASERLLFIRSRSVQRSLP